MLPAPFSRSLVLTGPTASGKTGLAIALAQRMNAEIIAMDSMTLYRGMNVGTAKPSAEERRLVAHHLIDVLEPWESWGPVTNRSPQETASVAWWLERAAECCRDIESRGKQVLFVGGTPLYLKALMFGLFDGPAADADLRHSLTEEARLLGAAALHGRLREVDPVAAERIHANDVRRVVRALEVFQLTGRPISSWQTEWDWRAGGVSPLSATTTHSGGLRPPLAMVLDVPRIDLYERINRRVEEMFAAGLVEEVRALRETGRPFSMEASQAVGYKEVFTYLSGEANLQDTMERVKMRTRQFAKRQMTWFRHLPGCQLATSELTWKLWQFKMDVAE